ncbi:MAG TPA: response regulator [Ktedonobacteraceae bacterium]|nr:response regulator [Ktedonobacteraceae bacterium]
MRVGLLEDDVAIQEMLLLVLQDEGHSVLGFSTAEECLEALNASEQPLVDLMIVDWRLGGFTFGTEVIRQIRNDPRFQSLPIILTTAASLQDNDELQSFQVALLEKPFSVDEMISLINELTDS